MNNIFVTGAAGFIGAALCEQLLARGDRVFAVDNFSDYYSVDLKKARLARLRAHDNFVFETHDLAARAPLPNSIAKQKLHAVVHLAAQPGVRYSLENPSAYIDANLLGFANILELCRHREIAHLVFASSSSVYGGNQHMPFNENDPVDHPLSLYAASKKANEVMAHAYAHLYRLPCTGLRFFTVYGPWGRPDMAFFKFTELILAKRAIPIYHSGNLTRDFTYIDDVVEGILRVLDKPATADPKYDPRAQHPKPAHSDAPFKIYNLGNGKPLPLMDCIHTLEKILGVKAEYQMLPMQAGDVFATNADMHAMAKDFDFHPKTEITEGLTAFVKWYRAYYKTP